MFGPGLIFTNDDWKHVPRTVLAIVEAGAALTGDARSEVRDLADWKVTEAEVRRRATESSASRGAAPVLNRAAEEGAMTSSRRRPGTWVTDLRHFLDGSGAFPEGIPGPALNLALFLGAIVAWVTSGRARSEARTNAWCRRRRCPGEITASFEADGAAIVWRCSECGHNGVTRGWEGTRWDRRTR